MRDEYSNKCDSFEESLNYEQQKSFYKTELFISTLNRKQRKQLSELVMLLDNVIETENAQEC